MRILSFLITFLLLPLTFQCSAATEIDHPDPIVPTDLDIDLSQLTNNYLDLSSYRGKVVRIGGHYRGDRIVLTNTNSVEIEFINCQIQTTHPEEALVFADAELTNLTVEASGLELLGGGITCWGHLQQVVLQGGRILDGHTGIKATKDFAHQHVIISGWTISGMSHEGIYLGVSEDTPNDTRDIYIMENDISNTGWDAIQVGNCQGFYIYDNQIRGAGSTLEYGQDYGITVNPGSRGYIYQNDISDTPKEIQVLDSRVFFHAP